MAEQTATLGGSSAEQDRVQADVRAWAEIYGGAVQVAAVLCDAHVGSARRPALVYEGPNGASAQLSYAELRERSTRFAGGLRELGVGVGDRVAVLLPKSPELVVALLGIWRLGAVHVPLFTAFGPEAVEYRVRSSGSRIAVTDAGNAAKLAGLREELEHVVCVDAASIPSEQNWHDFARLGVAAGAPVEPATLRGDDLMTLLYTSGTTGQPKGVEVPVRALGHICSYMRYSLDVRPEDRFWNVADPGWAYGLWFGLQGSLLLGQTLLLRNLPFDPDDVLSALRRHRITNLAAAPTAYRAIRSAGVPATFRSESKLRVASSAGEPLNPELLEWSQRELGVPIHDHFGQSELGMPLGNHHHPALRSDVLPGSMGVSSPGFRAVILDEQGVEATPGEAGQLAIDTQQSPLFCFRGYYRDPERTAERFPFGGRYYLTGDTASVDAAGRFHFASRADDVILSAGYRIGPFEIENVLIAHPGVAEVAVVGTPDELRGEAVTAYVVPAAPVDSPGALAAELQQLVKSRLAAHLYPRRVELLDSLPRTPSGKVQRNRLRELWRERGDAGA